MKKLSISIMLIAIVLLQSCHATGFHKTSVSFSEAYESNGIVKATTTLDQVIYFKYIDLKDSIFYGAPIIENDLIRLDTAQFSGLYLENINKTRTNSLLLTVGLIGLSVAIFYLIMNLWWTSTF